MKVSLGIKLIESPRSQLGRARELFRYAADDICKFNFETLA